jgi:RNA polymerase sigma-54 factor
LRDHVAEQIAFTFADPAERLIATDIADQLDAAGYIAGDLAETVERLSIDQAKLEHVLWRGFRNSNRPVCLPDRFPNALRCNLRARTASTRQWPLVVNNLELLARRDFATLKRTLRR